MNHKFKFENEARDRQEFPDWRRLAKYFSDLWSECQNIKHFRLDKFASFALQVKHMKAVCEHVFE